MGTPIARGSSARGHDATSLITDSLLSLLPKSTAAKASFAGFKPLDLENPAQFYYLALTLLVAVYWILHKVLHAPFGRALAGIRVNEQRMRSIGFPVFSYKLGAFVLAGTIAGLSGYLAACQYGFVNPEILAWHQSGTVLMMVILGGMGRLHGAVIGAAVYVMLQELLSASILFGDYAKHWQLPMGTLIVLSVLFFPHGIGGFIDIFLRRKDYPRALSAESADD